MSQSLNQPGASFLPAAIPATLVATFLFFLFAANLTAQSSTLTRSHQEMLKSKSMGGTANTCSMYCIEHLGGYLVLSSGKDVFRLDRAYLVHGFWGQKVKLTGVMDAAGKQIHTMKIELDRPK